MLHSPEVPPQEKTHADISLLFVRKPIMLLFAAWGALMVIAALSLVGLLNPNQNQDSDFWSESQSETVTTNNSPIIIPPSANAEVEAEGEESLPGFIASPEPVAEVASASSSQIPLWTFGAIALGCASGSLLLTFAMQKSSPPPLRSKKVKVKRVAKKPPVSPQKGRKTASRNYSPSEDPQVTILSNEFAHPLDSDQENLAAEMDLRKSQSLSSLLQNW